MTGDFDVEKFLRRQRLELGEGVRRKVMVRFNQARGDGRRNLGRIALWKLPVPLYIAVAGLLVSVGIAFLAGRGTLRPEPRGAVSPEKAQVIGADGYREPDWFVTKNDLL